MQESLKGALDRLPMDCSEKEMIEKCTAAFDQIQKSWSAGELKDVRKFLSDGMFQKFNTQLVMMDKLSQTNEIEKAEVINCKIADTLNDGMFTSVSFEVHATMKDSFTSSKFPELDESSDEQYIEYGNNW